MPWVCELCTYRDNADAATVCEVCDGPHPDDAAGPGPPPAGGGVGPGDAAKRRSGRLAGVDQGGPRTLLGLVHLGCALFLLVTLRQLWAARSRAELEAMSESR